MLYHNLVSTTKQQSLISIEHYDINIIMENFLSSPKPWNCYQSSSVVSDSSYLFNNQTYRKRLTEEADRFIKSINNKSPGFSCVKNQVMNLKKSKQLRRQSSSKLLFGNRVRSISNFSPSTSFTNIFDKRSQKEGANEIKNNSWVNISNVLSFKNKGTNRKSQIPEVNVLGWSKKQRKKQRRLTGLTDYDKISNQQSTVDMAKQNIIRHNLPSQAIQFRKNLNQLCNKFRIPKKEHLQYNNSQRFSLPKQELKIKLNDQCFRLQSPINNLRKSDFQIGKKLGSGNFSTAYLVRHKKTGGIFALKIMQKQKIREQNYQQQVIRQIKIQSHLNNPNLVQLYAVFDDITDIYLLMQYCSDGQLYNMIRKQSRFQRNLAVPIIKGIGKGIQSIHHSMVIHRDLKPENIFLSFGVPKIGDFGWAVYTGVDGLLRKTTSGSPLYYSPEVVQKHNYDDKIDIWGLGMITFEILVGMAPFKIYSLMNLDRIIRDDVQFPSYLQISSEAISFIQSCLKKNPKERWSIQRLLRHQFLFEQAS